MTSRQQDWLEILAALPTLGRAERRGNGPASLGSRQGDDVPPWSVRLRAQFFAARYDRQIENGISPEPGTPLAVHRMRLTSPRERDDLANSLRLAVQDACFSSHFNARAPIRSDAVHGCVDLIYSVCDRLAEPSPVRARGMARLRILLADGRGPLYWPGRGSLNAALRGVLAAL